MEYCTATRQQLKDYATADFAYSDAEFEAEYAGMSAEQIWKDIPLEDRANIAELVRSGEL